MTSTLATTMLFERFTDEAAFRADFVRPLLTRLGFVSVAELHGANEFGKDFVFSELTPFGFLRHYATVVKHEKSISQSATVLCNTVLAQVRQAFSVTFQLPDSEAVNRVSNVIVFNSGKITDNARKWLRAEIDEERHGRNVHWLDGESLFQLDFTSSFRRGEQLIPRLNGLVHSIDMNLAVWNSIQDSLPQFNEGRGCFTSAFEDYLASPFLIDRIPVNDVSVLIQQCRIIERICQRYMMPLAPKGEQRDQEISTLKQVIDRSILRALALKVAVQAALSTFTQLSTKES